MPDISRIAVKLVAVHKLFSALSRVNQSAKSDKDIQQAATVICAMEDKYPGDIEDAINAFPEAGIRWRATNPHFDLACTFRSASDAWQIQTHESSYVTIELAGLTLGI